MKVLNKDELKDIERLKEKRNLSKEAKDKIIARVVANWAICISIAILIMTFVMASKLLAKSEAILIYNVYSIVFLMCAIVILEIAYKRDSGAWAICGIEILILAIFTLFAPYIFFKIDNKYIYISLILITIYYIVKIIKTTYTEKKKYLLEVSDISDIIKKESKDELAQDFQAEREERIKENIQKAKEARNIQKTKKSSKKEKTETVSKKANTVNKGKIATKKTTTANKGKVATKKTTTSSEEKTATKKATTASRKKTTTKKISAENTRKAETKKASITNKETIDNTKLPAKRGRPRKIKTEDSKTKKETK